MSRQSFVVLVSLSLLTLGACGDDSPNKPEDAFRGVFERGAGGRPPMFPGGMPPGMPGGSDPGDAMRVIADMGQVELTDEMMAGYVEVLKKLKDSDLDTPGEALLTAHSLDWRKWVFVTSTIARATIAVNRPDQIEAAQKAIVRARTQAAQATDDRMNQAFEKQAQGFEAQLRNLENMPPPGELDRKNFAVYERWRDRIEEAGK